MYARGYNLASVRIHRSSSVSTRRLSTSPTPSPTPRDSQSLTLPDGRSLGFAEYGSPTGAPIFYFHGLPCSRLEGAEWRSPATKHNARIISVDRPGMGLSSFQPNRRLLDWPADVHQLAQHLKLDQYRVIGSSGGGPYALACAQVLPKQTLRGVGVVAGMGPWKLGTKGMWLQSRIGFNLMAWAPAVARLLADRTIVRAAQNPDPDVFVKMLEKAFQSMNSKDRAVFQDEETRKLTIDAMRESHRQGVRGYMEEGRLLTSAWGFEMEEVPFEKVRLWYGTEDQHTPIRVGRYMAERLRNAVLKEYPGDTHWTITVNHSEEVLRDMLESD